MKKTDSISRFCYLFSVAVGIIPVLIFLCMNGGMSRYTVFGGVFTFNALAAVLNRLTPEKFSRILPKIYSLTLTAATFFIYYSAPLFYRLVLSAIVLTLSIFMQRKNENTITGVYAFVLITFADILFCFITAYSFPHIDMTLQLISYFVYVICFGALTCTNANTRFFKGKSSIIVPTTLMIPAVATALIALVSFPLAGYASEGITALLRLLLGNAGGGNTSPPAKAEADMSFSPDELGVSQGGPVVRYIIIAVFAVFAVFMLVYLRRELAEFISRLPQKFRRRRTIIEKIARHEEYTDFICSVNPEKISSETTLRKMWRKRLRGYRRMNWSQDKMRQGLELAQNGLILSGLEIRESDTVIDIEKKLSQDLKPYWHKAATCYMNCRYDGAVPQKEDEKAFDRLIEEIKRKI